MFGYSAFSEAPFATQSGSSVSVLVSLEGVASSALVSAVSSVTGTALVLPDGLSSDGLVNGVTVSAGTGVVVSITGLESVGETPGDVVIPIFLAGVESVGEVGQADGRSASAIRRTDRSCSEGADRSRTLSSVLAIPRVCAGPKI